jgi:flagellar biosynthesis protein FlhF
MTIKSFFADTVADAIRAARAQFGEDAMLLKSRRAPEEARHLGAYEVVFGITQTAKESPVVSEGIWDAVFDTPPRASSAAGLNRALTAGLVRRMRELEFDEELTTEFSERIKARLLAQGISDGGSASGLTASGKDALEEAIGLEAERFFERETCLEAVGGVAALIGPAGSGKTSTVVRLAVNYGLARKRRVILLAANDHRVAAAGKLPHYASLLGAECHAACRPSELEAWLNRRSDNDLILIDTPGYGPRDLEQARPLAEFLAQHKQIQKHLVVPATLKSSDLRATLHRLEAFGVDRLLLTRLDETAHCGPALSEAAASGKLISFLCTGQEVPGDLVPASRFQLAALLKTQQGAMASAA